VTSLWITGQVIPRLGDNTSVIAPGYDSYTAERQETRGAAGQRSTASGKSWGERAELFGDDVDGQHGLDIGVEPQRHLGGAQLLQRLGEAQVPAVDLDARL